MALRFPFTCQPISPPAIALGGRSERPRAMMILVTAIGPGGQAAFPTGLLDTGADDTVFREAYAAPLGIDLSRCPAMIISSAAGTPLLVRYAPLTLRITDGVERREWTAIVGFVPIQRRALLGFAGFQQYFTVTYHNDQEVVELERNTLYPGT